MCSPLSAFHFLSFFLSFFHTLYPLFVTLPIFVFQGVDDVLGDTINISFNVVQSVLFRIQYVILSFRCDVNGTCVLLASYPA